jgi:glc operon protein GlcG
MRPVTNLGEAEAQIGIAACREALGNRKKAATVAITDSHGELIALLRTDGCPLPSVVIAQNKAYTSARTRKPSGDLGRTARKDGWDVHYHGDARYVGWDGGVPVFMGEDCVGAIGVSGLSGDEDAEIARIGIDAIRDQLD